ncbi:B12-binding domain-containing radical SAM protein [Patescibacteria group bacterium]
MIAFVSNNRNVRSTTVPVHYLNLSAFLSKHGIDNDIVEIKERSRFANKSVEYYDAFLLKKLAAKNYEYIGLSCYITDYNSTLKLAKKIKSRFPKTKIILGGPHVTLRPRDPFLSKAPISLVVIGEGEEPLLDLLKRKKTLSEISGICYKRDNKIKVNPPKCIHKDLSHIPLPAYDKIDMDFYMHPNNMGLRFMATSTIHIFTGLGCPFNCAFCANKSMYEARNSPKIIRYKTIDQVIAELRFLKNKYGLESFYIQDDTFTLNKERVTKICHRLIDENLDLLWGAETRVNLIDERLVAIMKKAGCYQLDFGVEAATQKVLDAVNKGITLKETQRAFNICRRHQVRSGANIMLNLPSEGEDDVAAIGKFLKKLKASVHYIALTVPFIGTEIYEKHVNPKLTLDEYKLFENPFLYGTIIDKRFRLAAHKLPLEKIIMKLRLRLVFPKTLLDFPLQKSYLRYLWKSKYKKEIFIEVINNFNNLAYNGFVFASSKFKTSLKK